MRVGIFNRDYNGKSVTETSMLIDMREYCQNPEYQRIYQEMEQIIWSMQGLPAYLLLTMLRKKVVATPIWSRHWEWPWAILSAAPQPGMRVLDAGCSASPLLPYLARRGCDCYGVDKGTNRGRMNWKASLLHRLGARLQDGGFYEKVGMADVCVQYSTQSIEDLSFAGGLFDRIFCISVLEHIAPRDLPRAMRELARVLSPGGRLVLTVDIMTSADRLRHIPDDWYPFSEYHGDLHQGDSHISEGLVEASGLRLVDGLDAVASRDVRHIGYFHPYDVAGLVLVKS